MEPQDYAETVHREVLSSLAGMTVVRSGTPDQTLNVNMFGEGGVPLAVDSKAFPALVVELVEDRVTDRANDHDDSDFEHHRSRVLVTALTDQQDVRGQLVLKAKQAVRANPNLATSRSAPRFLATEYGEAFGESGSIPAARMTFEIQFHASGTSPETPL